MTSITAQFIQAEEFEVVIAQHTLAIVDCTASWCGPCRVLSPLIDQLASEYEGQVEVRKLDVDQNRAIAKQYEVKSIPCVLVFKHGVLVDRSVGLISYEKLTELVKFHL